MGAQAANPSASAERFDAVYTWVDGGFPGYAELLQRYSPTPLDLNPNRYRDNLDMLRFSMRSLHQHAPWLGHVHLVTTRPQVPDWLDVDAPGISLVHHDQIFDPDHLPTFASPAIVSYLHRVPSVSPRFVYVEDDMLFGRTSHASDFIDPQGRIRFYESWGFEDNAFRHRSQRLSLWASILARSNHLLNERYGWRWHGSFHAAPIMFEVEAFESMLAIWANDVAHTRASRFRTRGTLALEHMFANYMRYEDRAVFVPQREVRRDTRYMGLENIAWLNRLAFARLRRHDPKFFCLNDNYGDAPNPRCVADVRGFLEEKYPEPSPWEKRSP
jgi:hypothetical protein